MSQGNGIATGDFPPDRSGINKRPSACSQNLVPEPPGPPPSMLAMLTTGLDLARMGVYLSRPAALPTSNGPINIERSGARGRACCSNQMGVYLSLTGSTSRPHRVALTTRTNPKNMPEVWSGMGERKPFSEKQLVGRKGSGHRQCDYMAHAASLIAAGN